MMQQPVGDFAAMAMAATPGGLGKHAVPPGTSPQAKKPLDRSTFERQQKGIPKQLSVDEMSAGFNNLVWKISLP